MRRYVLSLVFVLCCAGAAALNFPALTGRVVDDAHILSPGAVESLTQSLAAYEQESTNQVVVATIPSLEGAEIEDYGYQLGRHWGIGQKGKDNGVILLVAPAERKVRIEVGYGLEGTLTDAAASEIIQGIILPAFRQGQMEKGVVTGTYAIITALGGKVVVNGQAFVPQIQTSQNASWAPFILFIIFIILRIFILPWWFPFLLPMSGRGSGFGSGSFGGGFSGGGGGFGGGGASGGW